MACVNYVRSSKTATYHLFSQETDILRNVIMKCVNIKLWDILGCFHYILNPPRSYQSNRIYMGGSRKLFQRESKFDYVFFVDEERIQIPLLAGHHRPAIETPFKWRYAGVPMMAQH